MKAIWGLTPGEVESAASELDIPFATHRVDDVLLRKDVDLIVVLAAPAHHSQIAVKVSFALPQLHQLRTT